MTCEKCEGTGWVIYETRNGSAARRCSCYVAPPKEPEGTPLTEKDAIAQVALLCQTLAFAPGPGGQALVVKALLAMCSTKEQAIWLITETCARHTKWETCGIPGLRQILGWRYMPKDGLTCISTEAYPDGKPIEAGVSFPKMLALPPGRSYSIDPDLERSMLALAEAKSLSPAPRRVKVPDIAVNTNFKPFTEEDIRKAREEYREKKARGELAELEKAKGES
jgi:hypothetical protein